MRKLRRRQVLHQQAADVQVPLREALRVQTFMHRLAHFVMLKTVAGGAKFVQRLCRHSPVVQRLKCLVVRVQREEDALAHCR